MNYKLRIFSFILAIILCSVCFTISYADDKAQVSQTKLNKLAAFGVMSAEQNMSDYITRAEFTSVLIKAICQSGILTEAHTFTDVPNSHQYVAVIETAAALGLISGDGMGRFFPDEIIMLDDALKMVVTAINYNAAAIESGGYPNGYYDVSARIGLLDGWSADVSSKLTWADTAAMILNMWEVQAIKETYSPNGKFYEINNNATVFEKLWKNITKIKAEVISVDNIYNRITVNCIKPYKDNVSTYYVSEGLSLDVSGVVTLYVNRDDDVVVYIEEFKSLEIIYDYIYEVNGKQESSPLTADLLNELYLLNSDMYVDVTVTTEVYFNGKTVGGESNIYQGAFAKLYINNGYVEKLECYTLNEGGLIYRADEDELRFSNKKMYENHWYGFSSAKDLRIVIDGVLHHKLQDLKANMVFDWFSYDDTFIIVASSRKLSGKIEEITSDGVVISGEEYKISEVFGAYTFNIKSRMYENRALSELMGKISDFYIDDSQRIRFILPNSAKGTEKEFNGIVMATHHDAFEELYQVRVFDVDGGGVIRDLNVRKRLRNGSLQFAYLEAVKENLSGAGFLNFKLNDNGEVIEIQPVEYYGYSATQTQRIDEDDYKELAGQYAGEAVFVSLLEIDGEFTPRLLDWYNDLSKTAPTGTLNVISDFDIKNNPVPNYMILTGVNESLYQKVPKLSIVTRVDKLLEDAVKITFADGLAYTVDTDFISEHGIKKGSMVNYHPKNMGKYPIRIAEVLDFSGTPDTWPLDDFVPAATQGFFAADTIAFRNDNAIQFIVNGEPTDVYRFGENASGTSNTLQVYEYVRGEFVKMNIGIGAGKDSAIQNYVRSVQNYAINNVQEGDKVWFHVDTDYSPRVVDIVIFESMSSISNKKGEQ